MSSPSLLRRSKRRSSSELCGADGIGVESRDMNITAEELAELESRLSTLSLERTFQVSVVVSYTAE